MLACFHVISDSGGCVLLNAYILYCKIIPVGNVKPTYDYRIAVFGNDGIYPEEAVNFASSLNDELPNAVIEQIGIKIDCRPQGYNVYCVALDSETFANWYPVPDYYTKAIRSAIFISLNRVRLKLKISLFP